MESKVCVLSIARQDARSFSVLILSMVLLLLSGPILVKGQGPVYLFGDNITLPCVSTTQSNTEVFTWNDVTEVSVPIYSVNGPGVTEQTVPAMNIDKYGNFDIDNNYPNNVTLLINLLEVNDAGMYICNFIGQTVSFQRTVDVEALPLSVSISCERSLSTDCLLPESPTSDSFSCNCTAIGAYPDSLQFDWSSGATGVQQSQSDNNERNGTFDYYTNADIVPTTNSSHVTCTLNGYEGTWSEGDRSAAYKINPPICELKSICNETNTGVSLTCTCTDASPAEGLVYSFFRDGELLSSGNNSVFETAIEMGQEYTFGCRGCNGVNYDSTSYVEEPVICQESTTALPTTTITTVPLSTNEPTSTKAMGTTTAEPKSKSTDNPESGALGTGAIVGISLGALAVVTVIVVIAVIMCNKGKCGSKSDSSYATDGNSTVKDIAIYEDELSLGFNEIKTDGKMRSNIDNGIVNDGMEVPPPIYAEMKKKSDKPDNNGAGPGVDPEIPAYGVIDKNRTKDPTPVSLSSMRDSTNSSKPKQPNERKYAVIDHSNKPPSDEVIKPKEESTE